MIVYSDGSLEGLGVDPNQITSAVGGGLLSAAGKIALVNPLAGGIVAAAGFLTTVLGGMFGKPDYTKIAATHIVDAVEAQVMKPNLLGWQALTPTQKTSEVQAEAIQNFQSGWNKVVQGCSDAQLGTAGQACINDRSRGGKWDWFAMYLDPIANDTIYTPPSVVDTTISTVSGGITSIGQGVSNIPPGLLLLGAGLAALAFLGD